MAARLRRLIADAPASDAIPYRAAIMATVLISIVAAMTQEAVPRSVGVVSVAVIPFGFVFSYVRRGSRNVLLKFGLAGALFLAFAGFLSGVRGAATIDETRLPLATLFVWVQVLHSVDVPRRRDLGFSFAASIALISLAGSLAISSGFGFVVIAYAVAAGASLALRHLAELHEQAPGAAPGRTEPGKRPRTSGVLRPLAGVVAATVVCTTVAFVALPRFPGISVASLPIAIARRTPVQGFTGGVLNPGTRGDPSRGRGSGGGPESNFARDAYMGYGDDLNLRVRGRLSDTLVMRVRSPEPALWRAQVFDSYSDGRWTSSDKDTDTVRSFGSSINIPPSPELDRSFGRRDREVVQTFFIERQLPNLIFHAYEPREVFVPESSVQVDDFQSIRVPFILEPDTIYSVISEVPAATPEDLRLSPPPDLSDPRLTRYLEVPGSLSGGFRELAMQVTSGQQTSYDKVQAVENWLKRTKRYKIDIPPDPPGRDPVDVFVFDRHEGFCEQIAATMSL
ncbi:MAG TPA: DUF3488 and transglutaminase-like domain-containing protein, partial [Actinomycetota bacterium]|nr:DUF3488 and transglutaminase-like domain-containing protein [Actinomycetota bacterium]